MSWYWYGGALLVVLFALFLAWGFYLNSHPEAKANTKSKASDSISPPAAPAHSSDASEVGVPSPGKRSASPAPGCNFSTYVAGITKGDRQDFAFEVKVGKSLMSEREPDNRHDPYAVALWWRGRQLGYIPRDYSQTAAECLDGGGQLEVVVTDVVVLDENAYGKGTFGVHIRVTCSE